MIQKLRNSRFVKGLLMFALLNFLGELFAPSVSLALTGGPSQPEVESFTPIGSSDMVNLASGDFNYNIPLLDVGGYPINLAYNSGVTMDQEASWVGLGWNINPGSINRGKRGIPDDFKGDKITSTKNIKPNVTAGGTISPDTEVFGLDPESFVGTLLSNGINWNSYTGFFMSRSIASFSFNFGNPNKFGGTVGMGISSSTQSGLNISPSVSFHAQVDKQEGFLLKSNRYQANTGISWNSRQGLEEMTIGLSKSKLVLNSFNLFDSKASSRSIGGATSFASSTYTPSISHSMHNSSFSFSGKVGPDAFGVDISGSISGYHSKQELKSKTRTSKAFGYQYLNIGQNDEEAMLDFNREKDASYVKGTPNLPLSSLTYDLFNVSGQGVAGQFRSFQTSVGSIHDQKMTSTGFGGQGGVEANAGNAVKIGLDISINYSNSKSGKWRKNTNLAAEKLRFANNQLNSSFEPTYFRNVGEPSADEDATRYSDLGAEGPIRVKLFKQGMVTKAAAKYTGATNTDINDNFKRNGRVQRNQLISHLPKSDVPLFGLDSYTSDDAEDHHIGEFKITKNDGSKYVYGIPAYNTTEKSVTFNVGDKSDDGNGLVTYDASDNTDNNEKGTNHFYQASDVPPYSHSHLLTAVLSSDYQDADEVRGPSINDLGTYVKFSYDADEGQPGIQPSVENYKWRTPYQENEANFNEGLLSLNGDNMGSYIYGEKELWYVQKIETKTHVAVFHLDDRHDAYEVKGEDGGIDSSGGSTQKKLDKIVLYARPDYEENGTNATPIKTVHFEYSYDLCPNVPNNDGNQEWVNGEDINAKKGKLTLEKVYFTYGDSERGRLSSYSFNYDADDQDRNPDYDLKAYDMWGNYKEYTEALDNAYFPYVDQYEDRPTQDINASTWSMTSIDLPSGGKIEISYEADDYQYVQDKKAEQMFDVINVTNTNSYSNNTDPTDTKLFDSGNPKQFMWIELLPEDKTDASFDDQDFKDKYLNGIDQNSSLYFSFLMNLNFTGSIKDFVSGYAPIDSDASANAWYGVDSDGNGNKYGFIKIKNVKEENNSTGATDAHPIAKSTWQFIRSKVPQLLQPGNNFSSQNLDETNLIEAIVSYSVSSVTGLLELLQGPNGYVRTLQLGKSFDAGKSWVRLKNPDGKKVGGGSRVSKITVNDSWGSMVSSEQETANTYSQEYIYTLEDGTSSGVATFEPTISKENPFVQPKYFDQEKHLVPDERYMLEAPYGISYFPAPQVTYSKVTVRNTYPEEGNNTTPTERRTGKVVSEFYTSQDYPTIVKETNIKSVPLIGDNTNLLSLLNLVTIEEQTVSQGYSIEKNDMNGRLKSRKVYAEGKTEPISGVQYNYKEYDNGRLNNNVSVVHKSGDITTEMIGVDYDVTNDFRRNRSINVSGGVQTNFNISLVPPFLPAVWPTFYPSGSFEHTVFKSAVTTKIINRTAVLEEVIAFKDGASVSTKNKLWDAETGEVLLTQTKNEFNDDIYQMNFPAHWSYNEMGQAYQNVGLAMLSYEKVNTGVYTIAQVPQTSIYSSVDHFVPGDVVKVEENGNKYKAWVLAVDKVNDKVTLINKDGNRFDQTSANYINIQVIESGRENKQALAVGSVTSKVSPVDPNENGITDEFLSSTNNRIINASAMEYSDHWSVQKGVVGECVHQTTPSGDALISLLSDLIVDKHIGDGSVFQTVNTSSFSDYSDLFDAYNSSCPNDCEIEFANCNDLSVENYSYPSTTQLSLNFDCNGSTGNCDYPGAYNFYIEGHSQYPLDATYNFTNIESIYFDATAYDQYGSPIVGQWSDGTIIPLVIGGAECFQSDDLTECDAPLICGIRAGDNINPFVTNLRGAYRPYRSFVKLGDREQLRSDANTLNTRENGYINDFDYFWQNPETGEDWIATPNSDGVGENEWTWNSTITKNVGYNQNGMEQENKDALYRYSASIFGYQDKLPIAIAKNASKGKIGFDGFEDYDFYPAYDGCAQRHFSFDAHRGKIINTESHSGRHSVKLIAGDGISMTRQLATAPCNDNGYGYPTFGSAYTVSECEMYNLFGPETYDRAAHEKSVFEGQNPPVLQSKDNTYVISFWVKKEDQGSSLNEDFSALQPVVSVDQSAVTLQNFRRTNVIDGWQKIEYTFDVQGYDPTTAGDKEISISFNNTSQSVMFVDDIRVQPFNSSMKTYVYDPINFRLTAELDDNNFATFYEYDHEGKLIRVKKETERGIMTIQETRNHTQTVSP